MAVFLVMAGLTGSVIAFQGELDAWLNPDLYRARTAGTAPSPEMVSPGTLAPGTLAPGTLSPGTLAQRFAQQDPRAEIRYVAFRVPPGQSVPAFVQPRTDPATGKPYALDYDEVFLDPASGDVLGRREWGACCLSARHLVPFVYRLHSTLAAGPAGTVFMGCVAVLWALDCFAGLVLTWPRGRPFLAKWRPAWRLKRGAGGYRLTLDLHRATGLWLWLMLLLMAISGVALTLEDQVFRPVLGLVADLSPSPFVAFANRHPDPARTRIGYDRAVAIAAAESRRRGWGYRPGGLFDVRSAGVYAVYFFDRPTERGAGFGRPIVYLDDSGGTVLRVDDPGRGRTGDTILALQFPLHSGQVAGLAGRIAVALLGIGVAVLSVTGVLIWARKRRARRLALRSAALHTGRIDGTTIRVPRPIRTHE